MLGILTSDMQGLVWGEPELTGVMYMGQHSISAQVFSLFVWHSSGQSSTVVGLSVWSLPALLPDFPTSVSVASLGLLCNH